MQPWQPKVSPYILYSSTVLLYVVVLGAFLGIITAMIVENWNENSQY